MNTKMDLKEEIDKIVKNIYTTFPEISIKHIRIGGNEKERLYVVKLISGETRYFSYSDFE